MKRLAILAALLLGACDKPGVNAAPPEQSLMMQADSAHGVVCYGWSKWSDKISCVQIHVDTIIVRDGTTAVPRIPGSAWQHDGHVDRV